RLVAGIESSRVDMSRPLSGMSDDPAVRLEAPHRRTISPSSPRRKRLLSLGLWMTLVMGAASGTALVTRRWTSGATGSPPQSDPQPGPSAAQLGASAVAVEVPTSSIASAQSVAKADRVERAPEPRARQAPPAPTPKDDCRVKFSIDATGRKIYKRNCL